METHACIIVYLLRVSSSSILTASGSLASSVSGEENKMTHPQNTNEETARSEGRKCTSVCVSE